MKIDATEEWPYLHYARFIPHSNDIVLVYNYDIYYCQGAHSHYIHRITRDGIPGVVFNGIPDWLYEGEYLSVYYRENIHKHDKITISRIIFKSVSPCLGEVKGSKLKSDFNLF